MRRDRPLSREGGSIDARVCEALRAIVELESADERMSACLDELRALSGASGATLRVSGRDVAVSGSLTGDGLPLVVALPSPGPQAHVLLREATRDDVVVWAGPLLHLCRQAHREGELGQQLAEERAKSAAVMEGASDALFYSDESFDIVAVNDAACELVGYTRDELVTMNIQDIIDEGDLSSRPLRPLGEYGAAGAATERCVRRKDGSVRSVEVHARLVGRGHVLGVARDITEKRRSAERLRQSEETFRTLIDSFPDAVAVHREGRFVYVNDTTLRLLGYDDASELLGRSVLSIVDTSDVETVRQRLGAMKSGVPAVPLLPERLLRRDGSTVLMEIVAMNGMFKGEPGVIVLARDVTQRKKLEARLLQADRVAAIGMLAAGVAHEINNPLTYVLLHLSALGAAFERHVREASVPSGDELSEWAQRVEVSLDGAQRVSRIVRDLKTFSKVEREVFKLVDVHQPLEAAVNLVGHELKYRARLVRSYGAVHPVMGNEGKLCQVFVNLLINASQALPEGNTGKNEVELRTFEVGGLVCIAVHDNGSGIAASVLSRIFDPFFTTKTEGDGAGLGLPVCSEIVHAHGGRIEVESEVGRGSEFRVLLPAAGGALVGAAPVVDGRGSRSSHPPRTRVLLVDDEPELLSMISAMLRKRFDVVACASALEAKAVLEEGAVFDWVLCDERMPGMTGPELKAWLEGEGRPEAERFVLMSGGDGPCEGRFLAKPFVEAEVLAALRLAKILRARGWLRGA